MESLKEAQIYGLPIIPFPYSERQNSRQNTEGKSSLVLCNTPPSSPTKASNHHYFGAMNQKRLITAAATDIRPSRKINYRVPVTYTNTANTINRRLNFDQVGFGER